MSRITHLQSDPNLGGSPQVLVPPAGADLLVVCFSSNSYLDSPDPVKWKGTDLIYAKSQASGGQVRGDILYLVNPSPGSGNLTYANPPDIQSAFWFRGVKKIGNPVFHTANIFDSNNDGWGVNVNLFLPGELAVFAGRQNTGGGTWNYNGSPVDFETYIYGTGTYAIAWFIHNAATVSAGTSTPGQDSNVGGCGASFKSGPTGHHAMILG